MRSQQVRQPAPIDALGRRARSRCDEARPRASSRSTRPGDRPASGLTVLRPRSVLAPGVQKLVNLAFVQCRPVAAQALPKHRFAELGQLERQAHPLRCCRPTLHDCSLADGMLVRAGLHDRGPEPQAARNSLCVGWKVHSSSRMRRALIGSPPVRARLDRGIARRALVAVLRVRRGTPRPESPLTQPSTATACRRRNLLIEGPVRSRREAEDPL